MKNKLMKTKYVIIAFFTLFITSCLDTEAVDFGNGGYVVQFPSAKTSNNFLQDENKIVYDFEIPVEYFGGDNEALSRPVTFKVAVNSNLTTATEGKEFIIGETEFTIPAGEKTGNIVVKVDSDELDPFDPKVLALDIIESSENVSDTKSTIEITLQGICPSSLAGTYKYIDGKTKNVTIKEIGPGLYEVSADNAFNRNYPFTISDVCDQLTVTESYIQNNFGLATSGTGTVIDPETIKIMYSVQGQFTNYPMTLKKQ